MSKKGNAAVKAVHGKKKLSREKIHKMLEALIAGDSEAASQELHAYLQIKSKAILEGKDEDEDEKDDKDEDKSEDDDDSDDKDDKKKDKKSKKKDDDKDDDKDSDDDDEDKDDD